MNTDKPDDKEQVAVTPPGAYDSAGFRIWMENAARERGFTGLEWRNDVDEHGAPMRRLFGARSP